MKRLNLRFKVLLTLTLATWGNAGLWAQDQTWSLDSCINYALKQSIHIRESTLTNDISRVNADQARADRFPGVSATACESAGWSSQLNPATGNYTLTGRANTSPGVSSSLLVYNGLKLRNAIKQVGNAHDQVAATDKQLTLAAERVASVITMLAIGQGSKKSIGDQVANMGSNMVFIMPESIERGGVQLGNNSAECLKLSDVDAIRNSANAISEVSPEVRGNSQAVFGHENTPTTIFGVNQEYLDIKKITVESGRMFTDTEIRTAAKVCLLGHTVITDLYGENADPVGTVIRFKNIPFIVIGVLSAKGQNTFGQDQDNLMLAPYTTVQKRVLAITCLNGIYCSAVDEKASTQAIDQVPEILRKQHKLNGSKSGRLPGEVAGGAGHYLQFDQQHPHRPNWCHCRDFHPGGRHRDHEHHVCFGDLAFPGDRSPDVGRGPRSRYPDAISHRIHPDQRTGWHFRYPGGIRRLPGDRGGDELAGHRDAGVRDPLFRRVFRHRDILRMVPGQESCQPRSDRCAPLRVGHCN
jgi:hypothetical protein